MTLRGTWGGRSAQEAQQANQPQAGLLAAPRLPAERLAHPTVRLKAPVAGGASRGHQGDAGVPG